MAPEDPGPSTAESQALDHLYDLVDRLAAEIAGPTPDWRRIARDARELADAAEIRCARLV